MDQDPVLPLDPMSTFEDYKRQNGMPFWWASEFAGMLGYPSLQSFMKVIARAKQACLSSEIAEDVHFIPVERIIDGKTAKDYKLTRFACYLLAMNGDPKKAEIGHAQRYFAEQTRKLEVAQLQAEQVERLITRDEIKEGNRAISGTLKSLGATTGMDFARFQNEGFMGMYNMMTYQLENNRGVAKGELYDHMGRTELAANLFRIRLTEERINLDPDPSQRKAGIAHREVGKEVRSLVKKNTGVFPEELPQERRLPHVKGDLKAIGKKLSALDGPGKKKPKA